MELDAWERNKTAEEGFMHRSKPCLEDQGGRKFKPGLSTHQACDMGLFAGLHFRVELRGGGLHTACGKPY